MAGRVRRKLGLEQAAAVARRGAEPPLRCWLCERPLGRMVEWHHPLPKSRGGRAIEAVHPICHRTIHAQASNAELAAEAGDRAILLARPGIAAFLRWIANKPPDFRAPVRRGRTHG